MPVVVAVVLFVSATLVSNDVQGPALPVVVVQCRTLFVVVSVEQL